MEQKELLLISVSDMWQYSNAGVDQLAGYLRSRGFGCDIRYFHDGQSVAEMERAIPEGYRVYGFSLYSTVYERCRQLGQAIRRRQADAVIVFGGHLATLQYRELLAENDWLDYITLGDGERPTQMLLNALRSGAPPHISAPDIASHGDLENKTAALNGEILSPIACDYYSQDTSARNIQKIHCLQTKNNICTGNCSFCFERKGRIVRKPVKNIVDELETVCRRFGVRRVFFSDDDLFDPGDAQAREYVGRLCGEIQQRGLKMAFSCYTKATNLSRCEVDLALLAQMRLAGFRSMVIGIEAGNESDLRLYRKRATLQDNIEIMQTLKEAKLLPVIGFIGFNPYSTPATMADNFSFLQRMGVADLYPYLNSFLGIIKNTAIYEQAKADGLLEPALSISQDRAYRFMDPQTQAIVHYIRSALLPRCRSFQLHFDWLQQYVWDYGAVFPPLQSHQADVDTLCAEQCRLIGQYLSSLFLSQDIAACRRREEEFIEQLACLQQQGQLLFRTVRDYVVHTCG